MAKKQKKLDFALSDSILKDPEAFGKAMLEFLDECDSEGIPPTKAGLVRYMKTTMAKLDKLLLRPEYDDYFGYFEAVRLEDVQTGALTGEYNAPSAIFTLKNVFGWQDKQEIVNKSITANIDTSKMSIEQLNDSLKMLDDALGTQNNPIDVEYTEVEEDE